ncbi:hypothetical protein TNIN_125761 [Trichonephila inaurata madagascariensis]|uniref:Uncharacterized protein n=1 Tax=Trichonephila inaurata madagascariensis TaxID=2747483 RepID=A0A8X6Y7Y9_9ARAC|nr:hypothetical protein TNIN_125761 [Trichonephila inaurata madagascariensis]
MTHYRRTKAEVEESFIPFDFLGDETEFYRLSRIYVRQSEMSYTARLSSIGTPPLTIDLLNSFEGVQKDTYLQAFDDVFEAAA